MKDCKMLWDSMWECGTMVRAYKAKYFRMFLYSKTCLCHGESTE